MIINYNYDVTRHFVILSFHCFLSDLNVQKPVSQCTVTNTSGTVPLTNIPKSHTTKKLDVIKDDTQTNRHSNNLRRTQQKTLCSIGAIVGIAFLAIVIGLVFTKFVGKGGELVTIYNSY